MTWFKWCRFVGVGSVVALSTGACVPDNFWVGLWGDTVITGATSIVVEAVVTGVLGL